MVNKNNLDHYIGLGVTIECAVTLLLSVALSLIPVSLCSVLLCLYVTSAVLLHLVLLINRLSEQVLLVG